MAIKFRISGANEWTELLPSCRLATPFHQWAWLKLLEKYSGSSFYPLVAMKNETPAALFPLFLKKRVFNFIFSPPPHMSVPFLGPVFLSDDSLKQNKRESLLLDFQAAASSFIRNDLKASFTRINLTPGMQDVRAFKWAGYSATPFFNYTTDLSVGKEAVWSGLHKDIRNQVNKARNSGIAIRQGSEADFTLLLDFLGGRYIEQGISGSTSRQYFFDVFSSFKDNMQLLCAFSGDEFLGGILDVHFRDSAYSWIGAPKAKPGVNALLQWCSIESAIEKGLNSYVEIGANTKRLIEFKSKFNHSLSPYFVLQRSNSNFLDLTSFLMSLVKVRNLV